MTAPDAAQAAHDNAVKGMAAQHRKVKRRKPAEPDALLDPGVPMLTEADHMAAVEKHRAAVAARATHLLRRGMPGGAQ